MLEVIEKRRSCRDFAPTRVEKGKINEIIKAGLLAPSGMNRQTSCIIEISEKLLRNQLSDLNRRIGGMKEDMDPFYGAPTILLVVAKKSPLAIHDGAASMMNMLLEATNQGLETCWIHRANEEISCEEGRALLKFTGLDFEQFVGVGHIALGYAGPNFVAKKKTIADGRVYRH